MKHPRPGGPSHLVTEFRGGGIKGLFGPEVPIPDDAPLLDGILGVSGRDPKWQAPGR